MKLFKQHDVELIVIKNPINPQPSDFERHIGQSLDDLLRQVFPHGITDSIRFYHNSLWHEVFTERDEQGVDELLACRGRVYAVIKPLGAAVWIPLAIGLLTSAVSYFMMPKAPIQNTNNNQPPSPNNALAQRANKQRLGGRVADIFGTIWSVPDLIAPTYSAYINNKEVEFSYMCVGRGYYNVTKAYDDTTPINQIMGATVLVFDPNTSINDTPKYRFGSDFTHDEATLSRLIVKRYTSVNGQTLAPPNNYLKGQGDIYFSNGNMIKATSDSVDFTTQFSVGAKLTVENAGDLKSANDVTFGSSSVGGNLIAFNNLVDGQLDNKGQATGSAPNCYDPTYYSVSAGQSFVFTLSANGASNGIYGVVAFYDSNKNLINMVQSHHVDSFTSVSFNAPANASFYRYSLISRSATATLAYSQTVTSNTKPTYNFNGVYMVSSVSKNQIVLDNPASVASDWTRLNNTTDQTKPSDVILSTANQTLYQGWFYTGLKDHENILLNFKAPNGLYTTYGSEWVPISVELEIESELVDVNGNFIAGTNHITKVTLKSPNYDKYLDSKGKAWIRSSDESVRNTVAISAFIDNPNFGTGKLLRFRVRRSSNKVNSNKGQVIQEVKIVDFYGVRSITNYDTPKGVTTVYAKTLATEGAQSVKDRKLRLLVQRYLNNYRIDGGIILSNRADDIIFNIATDKYLANLDKTQVDMPQISSEIDKIAQVFGTPLCTEFCYTFDDNKVSAEEMIQTVAKAVFSQAYRFNNKIQLLFERRLPLSVAIFNSHNIIPDSYTEGRSFGVTKDYDGVKVDYIDPIDDAQLTLKTSDGMNNPDSVTLVGVRNKVQAYMHMMRTWNKHQYSYKSCEFTGGDESGIVIRSNRVTVASQYRANVQQGTATDLVTIGNDIVLYTSNPVSIPDGGYVLFIQTVDGNVDAMSISQYGDYAVKLPRLPSGQIAIGADNVVNAVYQIVSNADNEKDAYLVTEKSPSDGLTNKLTCINYTDKYYQNDADLSNGKITL